jgi:methionine--tRNA ligase beta chain|tara:strand:- start:955 stop:1296 length:342 start_codon:yes stop_codon:yes gene_type:complete
MKSEINFEDWEKLDVRVGEIIEVEEIEGADKLYKLTVDFGDEIGKRRICAGIKEYISKENLKGKKTIFLVNLAPRKLRGIESQGMILAAGSKEDDKFVILEPSGDIGKGSRVS